MEIIKLRTDDLKEYKNSIQKLLRICFQSTYKEDDLNETIICKYNGLIEYVETGKACTFGAIEDNCLIGFLWGYPVATPFETVFHIAYISVMESGRRKGVGQKLVEAAEEKCKALGLEHVELIVGVNNVEAMSFYSKCGYKPDRCYLRKEMR